MKNLPEPKTTEAAAILDDIIKRKKIIEDKNCLKLQKPYILERYSHFEKNKKELKAIKGSKIVRKLCKKALHSSFNTSFKSNMRKNFLKDVYEQCKNVCPYCGEGKIEELDHFIPEELFAEFTLYPGNLVPTCSKCNKKKLSKFINANFEREFINYYSDDINDLHFLKLQLTFDYSDIINTTIIKYSLDFSCVYDLKLKTIIENHFKNLDLLNRYAEFSMDEISHLREILSSQPCKDASKLEIIAIGTVQGEKNIRMKHYGNNDWKYLLYESLFDTDYITSLVAYAMDTE